MYLLKTLLVMLLFCSPVYAADKDDRAAELFSIVKCPTCAGQSVKESDTPAAKNIKSYIRAQIDAGASNEEIFASLSDTYGADVISRPKLSLSTSLLWLLPAALGLYVLIKARCYFCISRK
ncbi:MAG: cytochrome c-type biogenesis protein CcmH [Alphaproteobacteria bacterium]|jgi:cytochrome c-type biogenesis protein CcmH/NrfF|nr:cytochrome c-type biogenesis protein CcmH [Candidatus Jidaibacter sp.]